MLTRRQSPGARTILICALAALLFPLTAGAQILVQPLYPENSDIISGTYVFMVYSDNGGNPSLIDSVDYRLLASDTDTVVIDYKESTRMTKVDHDTVGLWVTTFNTNTSTTPDGAYRLVFRARDGGSSADTTIAITIQNAGEVGGPTIAVQNLSTGDLVSGDSVIALTITPTTGNTLVADSLQARIDGGSWTAIDSTPDLQDGGTAKDTLHAGSLTDGVHTVKYRAKDSDDQAWGYSDLIIFNVDNKGSAPTVVITSPADSAVKSGDVTVEFSIDSSNRTLDSVQIAIDGGNWTETDTRSSHVFSTEGYPDGTHLVQVRAFDGNDQAGYSQTVAIAVRNNPVSVAIASALADSVVRGALTVSFTVDTVPPATIQSTEISLDGRAWRATSTNTTDTIDTDTLTEGSHTIRLRATDSQNRTGASEIVKIEVRNAPVVTIDSAASGRQELFGVDTIRFTADYAPGASRDTTEIRFNGGEWIPTTGELSHQWTTTDIADGAYTVQVRAISSGADTGYSQVATFHVQNTPTAMLYNPQPDEVVSGTDTIVFTAGPPLPARITAREISIDGGDWLSFDDTTQFSVVSHSNLTDGTDSILVTISTAELVDGSHSVRVRAIDDNGRVGYSRRVIFHTQNGPRVTLLEPVAGDTLADTISVIYSVTPVSPATIATRMVSVDGADYDTVTTDTVKIDSKGMADGSHVVKVKVVDNLDRIGETEKRLFVVDNNPPVAADPTVIYPNKEQIARPGTQVLITLLVKDIVGGLATDSAVVVTSTALTPALAVMTDTGGVDEVAGDNVYTAALTVGATSSESASYTITVTDRLGNEVAVTGAVRLDSGDPTTWFRVEPLPQGGDSLNGETYFQRLLLKGRYSDAGGSGLARAYISVHNDSGQHANSSPIVLPPEDTTSTGTGVSRVIELVPGLNTIRLVAIDNAGNADTTAARITYYEPKATEVVGQTGGLVKSPNNVSVDVPANALLHPVEITVTKVDPLDQPKPLNDSLRLLNVAHDFGPDGTVFRKPATVTLTYTQADLDRDQNGEPDVDTSKLIVVFWNGETWLPAGKPTRSPGKVSVKVNHFTMFDIAEDNSAAPSELLVYWTNNPVKSDTCAQLVFDLPEAGKVTAYIMDMAGDLVWQLIEKDTPYTVSDNATWCGDNVAGRFAGAGLYVYVFKFTPNSGGEATIIRKPVGLLRQ